MQLPESESFLKTLAETYETAGLPAAILDGEFTVRWCSSHARELQPCLALPDGARSLLRGHDPAAVREEIAARGSFTTPGEAGLFAGGPVVVCALPGGAYLLQPAARPAQGSGVRPEGVSRTLAAFNSQYRAPLTVIFSMLTLLQKSVERMEEGPDREKARDYIGAVSENTYKLLRSCQWISTYAQFINGLSPVQPRRVDFYHYLRQLCQAAAQVIEPAGIPFTWDIPEGILAVSCDTDKLSFILMNLLSNACRFTRPGNEIRLRARKRGRICSVSVSDKGLGIPADVQPRVFEPYFSHGHDGRPYAGTGLGLCLVKGLTAAMGGTVTLTSSPEKGTTVLFTIPFQDDDSLPPAVECEAEDYLNNRFSLVHVALADSIRPPV